MRIRLNQAVKSLPASKVPTKKIASSVAVEGWYPAFSASGQDVWLPDFRYECDGIVVSAVGARCGKAFKATGRWGVVANTHPLCIDESLVDLDFAWRLMNNESWWVKSGSGQPFVKVKESLNREIELPDLETQRWMAGNLQTLDSLILKCADVLANLDELVKSRFIEMFGDVSEARELQELITPKTKISYGIVQPGPEGTGDMGAIRPVDIVNGRLVLEGVKRIDRSIGNSFKRTELVGDEILTVVRGATGQTVRSVPEAAGMNVTRGIAVIRYNPDIVDPDYLVACINSDDGQRYISEHTQGATLQQINIADLKIMPIPMARLELQQEFAAFVQQVDKSKFAVQQSIDKLQLLYDSLAQEYFGG